MGDLKDDLKELLQQGYRYALALVHEFIDGELEQVPHASVKAHFDVCQKCYPHLRLEGAFRDAVQRAYGFERLVYDRLHPRIGYMKGSEDIARGRGRA